ncbi:interleukin-12 receptor subunit beta-2 [Erinaceus europaeus]|uniref:Interleukin-12 receptor subunit beta-2 n=1 Tax=Erinaceus europaeus TaxID=9365 RepID=A0ABM3YJ28_ERIEU|nr:interleukin-12 receptor subunit beta-2 [Erinaceus europaeus]
MAHEVRRCSLALVFIIMLLLVKAKMDVCKRGDVIVRPSHVIALGSIVNITCSLKPKQGCSHSSFNQLILYRAKNRINMQPGYDLSSQIAGLPLGTTVFICKLACSRSAEVQICGAEILVGATGRKTTDMRVDLYSPRPSAQLNGPKNLTWQKQCSDHDCDHADLGISLSPESPEPSYTVTVTAYNSLGHNSSMPSTFTFLDIVKPLPPWDIRIKFVNDSVSRCTLLWKDERLVLYNRLRYRPDKSKPWNMVNATKAKGRHELLDLKPFTSYEFQISSKLHLYKGSWSNWSESFRTQTPEEEPTGMLDVWYKKQHIDYDRQRISLFWRTLSASEARGKILHYQVTLQEMTEKNGIQQSTIEDTSWTCVIPRTGKWAVTVSAVNSKGSSLPTRVNITDLCGAELLTPQRVSANSTGLINMVVMWEPPRKAPSVVQEYMVEWQEHRPPGSTQPPLHWLRCPSSNLSALISENIKPFVCYEFHVYSLSGDQGGCSSVRADTKQKAPLSGPHINSVTDKKGSILISWDGIPSEKQMGCVRHYRIYWKERDSPAQPQLCEIPYRVSSNSHSIDSLQPKVTYTLWMTALTAAGESPPGNEREFCLPGKASWSAFVSSSICVAVIIVGIFSIRYFRQKTFALLLALRPQWCGREIPDPANSTWAQQYPILEEKTQLHLDRLLTPWPMCEDPEPLVIKEVLHQVTPVFKKVHCPSWAENGQRVQGHTSEDTGYRASDSSPLRTLTVETGQLVALYKVLACRGPDSKSGNPMSSLTVLPVDYLPNQEGYLPSNVDDLPSHEAPVTDPPEELKSQHFSLSVFPSSSFHPLPFPCSVKLTLDQLKMGTIPLCSEGQNTELKKPVWGVGR